MITAAQGSELGARGEPVRKDADSEHMRLMEAYDRKNGIDWRDRRSDEQRQLDREDAQANRHRYPIPLTDPAYLYHGTSKARLASIKVQGLQPSERSRYARVPFIGSWSIGKVFFADTVASATFYAEGASKEHPAILRIACRHLADLRPDHLEEEGNFYTEKPVAAHLLEHWNGRKWALVKAPAPVMKP